MKMSKGSALRAILGSMSLGLILSSASLLTSCSHGDKEKDKSDEMNSDDKPKKKKKKKKVKKKDPDDSAPKDSSSGDPS